MRTIVDSSRKLGFPGVTNVVVLDKGSFDTLVGKNHSTDVRLLNSGRQITKEDLKGCMFVYSEGGSVEGVEDRVAVLKYKDNVATLTIGNAEVTIRD